LRLVNIKMKIYLVGGAVRDAQLNYPFSERDWVVTGASPNDLLDQGYTQVGKDFPVFLHPETKEEYALARTERKTHAGYTGFEFNTNSDVTIEEDLLRRDLTINAIAQDENGKLIDPYHGLDDLESCILRHVSDAFTEDPVRILRVARFAARYHHLGFRVADETMQLMRAMVSSGEVNALVAERCWKELERALQEANPDQFFQVLRDCGALKEILPELDALFGVPQVATYHPEVDTGLHALLCLQQACILSEAPEVRFASLVHDLGKALTDAKQWPKHHGHETLGLPALKSLSQRLKAPKEYYELAKIVMEFHTHCHRAFELKASTILRLFKQTDAYRRPERFQQFLLCCKADACGRTGFEQRHYPQANYLSAALEIANQVQTLHFVEQGMKGKEIGEALHRERLVKLEVFVKQNQTTQKLYAASEI